MCVQLSNQLASLVKQNSELQGKVSKEQSLKVSQRQEDVERLEEELQGERRRHEDLVQALRSQVQQHKDDDQQLRELNKSRH